MRHFLSFGTRKRAERAAQRIRESGWGVDVQRLEYGAPRWLVEVVIVGPSQFDDIEDAEVVLVRVAEEFGGDYDGHEVSIR